VGSHDTASAVAAVPATDSHFAYLSCGTWSLLGVESPTPIINKDSFAENFTNEGGLDHTTRFLKNITGLWIFEQCRKEWDAEGSVPKDVNALNALCMQSVCQSIIFPDDPRFAHPVSMTAAIRDYLTESGQALPQTPADYVRIIFRSLAARYRGVVESLRKLTSVDIQRLHVIGGGSRNEYLMQFTADALQLPVIAGPQEGTALGNALVQVRAAGLVGSLKEMRAVIKNSIELKTYSPR
jgi:rhamnulokinase